MLETNSGKEIYEKIYEEDRKKFYYLAYKILHNESAAEETVYASLFRLAERFPLYHHEPYANLVKLCDMIVQYEASKLARVRRKGGDCKYMELQKDDSPKGGFEDDNPEISNHIYTTDAGNEELLDITPDLLEPMLIQSEAELVVQAILQLNEEERALLNLQYGLGLQPQEIGELLDISTRNVRKSILICRNKLAKILQEHLCENEKHTQ